MLIGLLAGFVVLAVLVAIGWAPLIAADHATVLTSHPAVLGHPRLLTAVQVATDIGNPLAVNLVTGAVGVILLVRRRARPRGPHGRRPTARTRP